MILDFTFYVAKVTKLFAFFIILRQIVCTYKQKKLPYLITGQGVKKSLWKLHKLWNAKKWWSWRESNPRPNEETISFLHAYLWLHFRATAEPKPSTATLSPKFSSLHRSLQRLSPILLRHYIRLLRSKSFWVTSRLSTWCRDKADLLYFDQAARA